MLISIGTSGQCTNSPTVTIISTSGTICNLTPVTISGNTFGGSAKKVTITENGSGSVTPASVSKSPFTFTYTPKSGDIGKKVEITLTTDDPPGSCPAAKATYTLTVGANPSVAVIGKILNPTCSVSTGSVEISGLPSTGVWTLKMNPGGIITTGSGVSTSIPDLPTGTYTFTVTNSEGCLSAASANIVILPQPDKPAAPVIGTITSPTCILTTGSVQFTGLPASGMWTLTRYPGAVSSSGSGGAITLTGIPSGLYNYVVTGSGGCISSMSVNVTIPVNQDTPSSPLIGSVIQPHTGQSTGSVVLDGLPATGSWSIVRSPDNVTVSGTGITNTISGLSPGTYKFRITNSTGCTSVFSDNLVIIPLAGNPLVEITNPSPVCFPSTADLTDIKITAGSTSNLTFTYWKDINCTTSFNSPSAATAGTWYIRGMARDSAFDIRPVTVTVFHIPAANAGTDQVLTNQTETIMNAEVIQNYETGVWSEISGSGSFFDSNYAKTTVSGLSSEKNVFAWTVTNGICPPSSDTVVITVHDHLLPTLITPNMDGRNDYFVMKGFSPMSRIEFVVFDRRGNQVYKNLNYDNLWNGTDLNGMPLPEDTYFYVVKTEATVSLNGYIVIKR